MYYIVIIFMIVLNCFLILKGIFDGEIPAIVVGLGFLIYMWNCIFNLTILI